MVHSFLTAPCQLSWSQAVGVAIGRRLGLSASLPTSFRGSVATREARAFYRRAGFREHDRVPRSKRIGPGELRARLNANPERPAPVAEPAKRREVAPKAAEKARRE